jgi:amino acid transporter
MVTVLLMLVAIGFGAAALGRRFRFYSVATLLVLIAFGGLTGLDAPRIGANLPTPWIGIWEHISIGGFLLWIMILALTCLRAENPGAAVGNVRNP